LVQDLARPGWLIALLGHGKEGKTTLALHLMASLGAKAAWMERNIPQAMPTLYLGFEMHSADLTDLLRMVRQNREFVHPPRVVLDWPPPLDLIRFDLFLRDQPLQGFIVIDSYRGAFLPGRDDEKDAGV